MKHLLFLLLGLTLAACSHSSAEDSLRSAEMALANGDMRAAESAADHVVGSENLAGLSSTQLARLSMVYIQLADSMDREDNVGQATNYYRMAYSADPDSAGEYFSTLNADKVPYAMMLRTLAQSNDSTSLHDDSFRYPDSLTVDSIE